MRTSKDNLHRDYVPIRVIDHVKSSLVQGVVLKLRFKKVANLSFLQYLLAFVYIYKCTEMYYWLPYKNVVNASEKYSVIGSNSRFPFASVWFEVRQTHTIYKQGLNNFVFKRHLITEHARCTTQLFIADELLTLNRKAVIRVLDEFVFHKNRTTIKK